MRKSLEVVLEKDSSLIQVLINTHTRIWWGAWCRKVWKLLQVYQAVQRSADSEVTGRGNNECSYKKIQKNPGKKKTAGTTHIRVVPGQEGSATNGWETGDHSLSSLQGFIWSILGAQARGRGSSYAELPPAWISKLKWKILAQLH